MRFCELPGLSDWTRDRSALPTEVKTNSAQRWECAANEMFSIKLTVGWHQLRIDRRRLLLGSGRMCFNPKKKMERVSLFASSISENIDIDWSAHHLFFFLRRWTMTSRPEMRAKGAGSNFWTFRKKYLCCAQRQRLLAIVERYRSGHTATDFHIIIKCPSVAIRRSAGPPGPKIVAGNFSTSLTFSVEEKIH